MKINETVVNNPIYIALTAFLVPNIPVVVVQTTYTGAGPVIFKRDSESILL